MATYQQVCERSHAPLWHSEESVEDLWSRRLDLTKAHKEARTKAFYDAFEHVVRVLASGGELTGEQMRGSAYWQYLRSYHRSWQREPLSRRADSGLKRKFLDGVSLFHDIRSNGMREPLGMVISGGKETLHSGYRRLTILKVLGVEKARVCHASLDHNAVPE